MAGTLDLTKLRPATWCWVVQNDGDEQFRAVALFLEYDNLGDCWVTWKNRDGSFTTGQVSKRDLIPLHGCKGFDYIP